MKFKIGDKVRLKKGFRECQSCGCNSTFLKKVRVGAKGVICRTERETLYGSYGVNFRRDVRGHTCWRKCPNFFGQFICARHLEKVK